MKLIDLDKVVSICDEDNNTVIFANIKNAEVKAIPIEWIKEYASMKSFNDEMDCYWHFWEEDVLKMVADWEKENEERTNA